MLYATSKSQWYLQEGLPMQIIGQLQLQLVMSSCTWFACFSLSHWFYCRTEHLGFSNMRNELERTKECCHSTKRRTVKPYKVNWLAVLLWVQFGICVHSFCAWRQALEKCNATRLQKHNVVEESPRMALKVISIVLLSPATINTPFYKRTLPYACTKLNGHLGWFGCHYMLLKALKIPPSKVPSKLPGIGKPLIIKGLGFR